MGFPGDINIAAAIDRHLPTVFAAGRAQLPGPQLVVVRVVFGQKYVRVSRVGAAVEDAFGSPVV